MASDDDKNESKFWLGVNDDQDDVRTAFQKKQAAQRGAIAQRGKNPPARSEFWANLTDKSAADRAAFFAAQEPRRKPMTTIAASAYWLNTTSKQRGDRDEFFLKQKTELAIARAKPKEAGSEKWSGITADNFSDRAKFFKDQKDIQEYKRRLRQPGIHPPRYDEDGNLLPPPKPGSKFWLDLNEDQLDKRNAFMQKQNDKRSETNSAAKRLLKEAANKAKLEAAAALSTSSQWSTDVVFNYHVAVPSVGIITHGFRRISGLSSNEMNFESYHEGGDNLAEHILPRNQQIGKIVLEWSVRHPDPFQIWLIAMGTGVMIKHPINISMLDHKGTPTAMWFIPMAMIARIDFPEFDAMDSSVATNKVELIHNGLVPIPI